jgi:hypothetical protein
MGNIDEISHKIGSIETKVDGIRDDFKDFMERFDRHDSRLTEIERFKNHMMGVVAIISLVFTLAFDFVKNRILGGS